VTRPPPPLESRGRSAEAGSVRRIAVPLATILALLALALGGSFARSALGIEWSAEGVRDRVRDLGAIAPLVFVLLMTFRFVVMIPSPILLVAGGLCFGAGAGALYGAAGLTAAALWKWGLVQWAGADAVRARVPGNLHWVFALARSRFGAGALALASGYPLGPISGVHLAAAVAGTGFASFAVAVGLGSLLRAFLYAFFGSTLATGRGVALGAGLLGATLGAPLLVPSWRRWLFETWSQARAGSATDPADAGAAPR
jgi:uncharacterized membrane protein YdjX (TVP38/TMEM64 family)